MISVISPFKRAIRWISNTKISPYCGAYCHSCSWSPLASKVSQKGAERQPLQLILFWLLDLLIMWCLCILKNAVGRRGSNNAAGRCGFLFWKFIFNHPDEGVSFVWPVHVPGTPSSVLLLGYLFCMFVVRHKAQKWIRLKKIHRINQQQTESNIRGAKFISAGDKSHAELSIFMFRTYTTDDLMQFTKKVTQVIPWQEACPPTKRTGQHANKNLNPTSWLSS